MSHTPGPWKVNKYGGIGAGERGIDKILVDSCGIMDGVAEDYALMAAAPELLDACKWFIKQLEEGVIVRDITKDARPTWAMQMMRFVMDLQKATSAIEKAEGK